MIEKTCRQADPEGASRVRDCSGRIPRAVSKCGRLLILGAALLVGCTPNTEPETPRTIPAAAATEEVRNASPAPTDTVNAARERLDPATAAGLQIKIYKETDDGELPAHIFYPPDHQKTDASPVLVFFHGGGWFEGEPENGYPLCEHWASLGMVCISFAYRLAGTGGTTPVECITDAKSAVRWVRAQADELGVDPDKITASGGSAGGHLAVSTAVLEGFEEGDEDVGISSSPDAVIAWSAAVNITEDGWFRTLLGERGDVRAYSPAHHVRPGLPPMALLHGTADETVPFRTVAEFAADMREAGNRCDLHAYEGGGHLFHVEHRAEMLDVMEEFFVSLGYLEEGT
ncbi:MAG: alpha/beta hydrolase [Anaerolineales bacterium]